MNRRLLTGLIVIALVWSCQKLEPIADNPLDPDSPVYEPPGVAITAGPDEGEIIDTSTVTFEWEGNEQVNLYRYRFDSSGWSDWSFITSATFDYLDEDEHSFFVQSQYPTGDTSEVMTVSFVVDAVTGPALMFFPRRHLASVGDTVTFQIMAEEVENLTAAEFVIGFDSSYLEIMSIVQGSMFTGNGESIFHAENGSGTLSVLTAILGGDNPSISGTGILAIIKVRVQRSVDTDLTFDGSELLRDPNNNNITILESVNGLISVP